MTAKPSFVKVPGPKPANDERAKQVKPALHRITVGEIFAPLDPIQWLVQSLDLCPGAANLMAGYGFSGKTVAAQAMALDIATGRRVWGAYAARSGRVLHVDYEQGRRLTLDRYQRLAAAHLITPDEIGDRLSVVALPSLYLDTAGAEGILSKECEDHALLIVDSLRAACPTIEENDSGVRIVLDTLSRVSERTGVVPLILHHARKPSMDKSGGAKMAIRGSGAIFDACASVLVFEGQKGQPTTVAHEKARTSGVLAEDFLLRISDVEIDGNPRGGLVVSAEAVPAADHGGMETRILEALERDGPAGSKTALASRVTGKTTDKYGAIDDLVMRGKIIVDGKVHRLPDP